MGELKRNYIAEVIEAAMSSGKITNAELAAEIGVTRETLDRLRFGQSNVQMKVIMKLATHFRWTEEEVGSAVWYGDVLDIRPLKRKTGPKKKQEGT